MYNFFATLLAVVIAYFIGAIPTGVYVGRRARGIDIRDFGSGNIGATNAMRVLGIRLGLLVLVLDGLKGWLPVKLLPLMFDVPPTPGRLLVIGAAAVIGHVFTVFAEFRGGKGVATTLGVLLALSPGVMWWVLIIALLAVAATGYVSAVAVTAAMIIPFLLYFHGDAAAVIIVVAFICAVVIIRHESNILRLLAGTEPKIWDRIRADERGAGMQVSEASPVRGDVPRDKVI